MPGGESLVWAPVPGQTWAAALASFLWMWMPMMAAMMLPSLAPQLWRYRQALAAAPGAGASLAPLAAAAAYLVAWGLCGAVIFALGAALSALARQPPSPDQGGPLVAGAVLLVTGALQFSPWKAHHLDCWRGQPGDGVTGLSARQGGWRHGLQLARHCICCCAGPTAALLVLGIMETGLMLLATALITLERLAPPRLRAAQGIGIAMAAAAALLLCRAAVTG
jgi:predicted metal-binding membrane protein